jgi:predicted Ser/Thr protein kinase
LSSDTLLAPGTSVAGYEVDSVLGQGGMAVVYRATQRSLKRTVALKLLAPELTGDTEFRERFEREGQLQAGIDHLHIVPIYEAGQSEHGLFLAMRLIAGPTLKELIQKGELDARRTLRLLAQVAQALDAAHATGLIHRDVKPQNILVGENDHAYLADFGLTKAPGEVRLTDTGQFMGTIDYVAPEQIRGETAGPAADCYALAAVLYECLTGEPPFARATEAATLQAQLIEAPPKVTEHNPGLPPALDDVIAAGMSKDPGQRPAPVSELIRSAFQAVAGADAAQQLPGGQATRRSAAIPGAELAQPTRAHGAAGPVAAAGAAPPGAPTVVSETAGGTAAAPARGRTGALILVAVLGVVAIAAGFLVGHSGTSASPSGPTNLASVGHLQLSYPTGWQVRSAGSVPGMSFRSPLTLTAANGTGTLTAGEVTSAGGPTLLAPSYAAQVTSAAHSPAPDRVLLGSVEAYRYNGLSVLGSAQPATIYAIPTTAGVATLVCLPSGNAAAGGFQARCGRLAASLHLMGASAYPIGPSAAYAKLLSTTLTRLRSAAATPARDLAAATTPSEQASAATRLSSAYTRAGQTLAAATVSPLDRDANAALAAALRHVSAGYAGAAGAAGGNSSSAYARAGQQVRHASAALGAAAKSLAGLGYHVAA